VSDDPSVYGEATYHCTSAHGPMCPTLGAVGEHESNQFDVDADADADVAVIIELGKDVDVAQVLRMFEGGAFDDALRVARNKKLRKAKAEGKRGRDVDSRTAFRSAKDGPGAPKSFLGRFGARDGFGNADGSHSFAFSHAEDGSEDADDDDASSMTGKSLTPDANVGSEGVRSTPTRETRKVEFLNARSKTVAVYWIDFEGKETHYADLPPGATTLMSTFAAHSWVARDMASTEAIAMYTIRARRAGESQTQRFVVADIDLTRAAFALVAEEVEPPPAPAGDFGDTGDVGDVGDISGGDIAGSNRDGTGRGEEGQTAKASSAKEDL